MADFGLTPTGFIPKTFEILLQETLDAVRDTLGFVPVGVLRKFIGIIAERWAELWELGEAINSSLDPDAATGASLDSLAALTGTFRDPASKSAVILTLTGTPGTDVLTGSAASTVSTQVQFVTENDAEIALLPSWVASTAYVIGNRVTNSSRAYVCITSGTSAGSGGPTTTSSDITDNTVHWRYIGEGTGAVDVDALASITGPLIAESGDITVIDTPVFGWDSVINLLDADPGSDIETDAELRTKRRLELTSSGDATADAIRADLLQVEGVTFVNVFNNNTDTTDADGVPPHSVEILVQGGDDQDIWDAIGTAVPVGIGTFGGEVGTFTDDEGEDHTVRFSRPTIITAYVDIELTKDPDTYPIDGDDAVKLIVVTRVNPFPGIPGLNIVASRISAAVFFIDGVLDVTLVQVGTAPSPSSSATISVGLRELAEYDTSRITVVSVDGTP